jgi:hypothetical protein
MVMTLTDDDHHTFEMFAIPPGGKKEMKMMTINYVRNSAAAGALIRRNAQCR